MNDLKQLLLHIVRSSILHAKWLNTLSYLENSGARSIAACEHPTRVKEEMLKHAAEEFRHAHFLKQQISKATSVSMEDYSLHNLLGGVASLQYLKRLNLEICRYLKQEIGLNRQDLIQAAYLLVTYAIECRAEELYSAYDEVLREAKSKIRVKSIFLEELEHLEEMRTGIRQMPEGERYAKQVHALEGRLYHTWLKTVWAYTQNF